MAEVKVRFRHANGDLGPFNFSSSCKVKDMRQQLYQEWPQDGRLGKSPANPQEVSVILGGRFLDEDEELTGLLKHFGEVKPTTVITMHALVRSVDPAKSHGNGDLHAKSKQCCCVQ